jgi:hypothetical protein
LLEAHSDVGKKFAEYTTPSRFATLLISLVITIAMRLFPSKSDGAPKYATSAG